MKKIQTLGVHHITLVGASMVVQVLGRSARWRSMRLDMSSSSSGAVAT